MRQEFTIRKYVPTSYVVVGGGLASHGSRAHFPIVEKRRIIFIKIRLLCPVQLAGYLCTTSEVIVFIEITIMMVRI